MRVGFAAGAGPMLSAWLFSDSEAGTVAVIATFSEAGTGSREADAFVERGSKPVAALGGLWMRAVLGVYARETGEGMIFSDTEPDAPEIVIGK